jgi:hypothetical protein
VGVYSLILAGFLGFFFRPVGIAVGLGAGLLFGKFGPRTFGRPAGRVAGWTFAGTSLLLYGLLGLSALFAPSWWPLSFDDRFGYCLVALSPLLIVLPVSWVVAFLSSRGAQQVHNAVARRQHQRRQRLIQRQLLEDEWAGVPNGAISRARPPGDPEPTHASLSRAEAPEEEAPPRLAVSVDREVEVTIRI